MKKGTDQKEASLYNRLNKRALQQPVLIYLLQLWNRMSSGSYFPQVVKGVEIPKKNSKKAQMVVKLYEDSYGYRPNRSAIDVVGVTRPAIKHSTQKSSDYSRRFQLEIKTFIDRE